MGVRSLAAWWLLGAGVAVVGCGTSAPAGASASASQRAPVPEARRDLGSLADFKARWDAAAPREKVPRIGDAELVRAGANDVLRPPVFAFDVPVTLEVTVDHETQRVLRATLDHASGGDAAREALRRLAHVLLDAVDPNATSQQHEIAALSIPSGASGSGDFFGGYTIAYTASTGEFSIAPTSAARLEEISKGTAQPIR